MKKSFVYKLSFLMITILFISFGLNTETGFVFAETAKELEEQIENKTSELKKLEEEAQRIKEELSKTTGEKATLSRELSIINGERKSLENNIAQTKSKIGLLGSEIKKTEKEINEKNSIIVEQSIFLELLIRRVNQQETFSMLENFLTSESLSVFFKMRDQYLALQNPILNKTNELRNNKLELFSNRLELEDKQGALRSEKEKFYDQKSIVVDQENKKKTVLEQTKNKESEFQKNLAETNKRIAALDKQIRDYESKLQFILDESFLPKKGSEVFDWPLPKSDIYITQRFGKTTSSGVLYSSGSHSGTDFRAAIGTPIYATADGEVMGTGNTDDACAGISFGKWILIEHDIGLSTTYGHLSKIKISKGKKVKKGDLIGYSGNTGHSTGPHLHLTTYATYGSDGKKVVKIIKYDSWTCPGESIVRPSAPTGAYLNSIDYLPKLSRDRFKHPRL